MGEQQAAHAPASDRRVRKRALQLRRRMKPHSRLLVLAALMALSSLPAPAQDLSPTLSGTSLEGKTFSLAQQRGRVVMVVLWRTDCAVCLSKMPELRANALGWKGKPFDLVTVSLDARSADTEHYDRTRRQVAAAAGPVWSFWQGQVQMAEDWRRATRVPVTLVIDREGRIAARHEGRVPADVWDSVAELLP